MKRPWAEDNFMCFECGYFGGQDICRKFRQPLARKGYDKSCGSFKPGSALLRGPHRDFFIKEEAEA